MQFHGPADRYTLNGATAVATLYSSATTATSNPAVTLRSVGRRRAGSRLHLRSGPVGRLHAPGEPGVGRAGARWHRPHALRRPVLWRPLAAANWIDLNKVAIPQADEQQRLLANLILLMNAGRKPLPRFWYLPRGLKAVVVMTGDDHGNGGTEGRFAHYIAISPPGCSVENWECVRGTSYVYVDSILEQRQPLAYNAQGLRDRPPRQHRL